MFLYLPLHKHCSFRVPHLDIFVFSPEFTRMGNTLDKTIRNWGNSLEMVNSDTEVWPGSHTLSLVVCRVEKENGIGLVVLEF